MPTSPRIHLPYPDEDSSPWNEVFKALVEAIDLSLYSHREDRNTLFAGGGLMSFTASTGLLSWSEDIDLLAAFTGYRWRIQGPSSVVLQDSQLAYVTISRAPQSLNVVQLTVGLITPNEPRGDDHYVVCFRKGSKVYFRNGKVISDGQTIDVFDQSGGIVIKDEGTFITGGSPTDTLNFVGATVTAADAGNGVVNITVASPVSTAELVLVAGLHTHDTATPSQIGGRYIDLAPYPVSIGALARQVTFKAELKTTAGTAEIRLRNVTDTENVTGTTLSTASTSGVEVSGSVTVGLSAGNLKTGKHYSVDIWITGGSPSDLVTCTNARLEISYV